MMLRIAFRNIFRQKRRTLLTTLTMFGGFVLCSFSISWMDGSYANVIDLFTRHQLGHIQLHDADYVERPSLYRTISGFESIGRILDGIEGVEAWTPRILAAGLASVGDKTAGVRIIGIDPEREIAATRFDRKIVEGAAFGAAAGNQAVIGRGLARRLHAGVGDDLVIVSQGADGSIANDRYTVIGILDSGDQMSDQAALYLPLATAQELLVLDGRVHEIVVIATSIRRLPALAGRIRAAIADPSVVVETWQEFARSFYDAMRADQQGNWISIFVITLLVAIGVLNTVLMSVLERQREYGLMRAMGTTPARVFGLVIAEVLVMAALSVLIGVVLSAILNYSLSFKGVPLPVSLDYGGVTFSRMYTEINLRSFLIPLVCVVCSAGMVAVFPALKAARTRPAVAMRTH